jgi:hypothetical protein
LYFSVLIDDRKDLQDDWEAAGGIFILHTDTVSSLQQLREKGIIKPHLDLELEVDAKVETPNDKELDVATTTTEADDETSKVASKDTQGMDTKAKTPNEDELNTVTTTNGADEETSKASVKETQRIPEPQSDTKVES